MSIRTVDFVEGEYYHLYNRGNSKQVIFHDVQDHQYFINLLYIMNTEVRLKTREAKESQVKGASIISVGAYCLMPNHFHIIVKQEKDKGITMFMLKLSTAYVMYYNKKYKRTGALFEGKFKSKYAGDDLYLKYLFAYIHLNPLKIFDPNWKEKAKYLPKDMFIYLERYPYSSFHEYLSEKFIVINKAAFPDYFPLKADFVKNITSWFKSDSFA